MKKLLFITMLLGAGYSQCGDMNGDGDNNILDIVILANCVLGESCADIDDCLEVEPSLCDGLTEVELWGEYYDIETTTTIILEWQGLTGEIQPEVFDLIENNFLNMDNILDGNNLINTCD